MPLQLSPFLSRGSVPQPDRLVASPRCNGSAVGRISKAENPALVSMEFLNFLACCAVPHNNGGRYAVSGNHAFAIRGEGHSFNPVTGRKWPLPTAKSSQFFSGRGVPNVDPVFFLGGRNPL